MTTLHELIEQRMAIDHKIAELRLAAIKNAISEAKKIIAEHDLTASDLGFEPAAAPRKAKRGAFIKPPKFKDPETGKTWSGYGRRPMWIDRAQPVA